MKKILLFIGLIFFAQTFLSAQNSDVTFSVNEEKVITYKNQVFKLIYTVEDNSISYGLGKGYRWEFPNWKGVEVIGSPNKSTTSTIVEGKRQYSIRHIYSFKTSETGTFVFPSATFFYKDKKVQTNPVEVQVLPEIPLTDSLAAEQIFIRLELHPAKAMVGEKVRLDLRAYSLNLPSKIFCNDILEDWEVGGIYYGSNNFKPSSEKKNIMVDGILYSSRIIFSKDIYAYHEGNFKFPQKKITISSRKSPEEDFFYAKKEILETAPVELEVYALQDKKNPYPSVNGSNINFNMIDTALQSGILYLDISVEGKSDPMYFAKPYIGLEKVAKIELENTDEKFSRTAGGNNEKTFQYKISFLEKGTFDIHPEWTTWNTEKKKWNTISADSRTITVASKATISSLKKQEVATKKQEPIPHAIVFAVDLSSSMLTQDFKPSRMAFVKERLKHFFEKKTKLQQYAIVGFAGETRLLCPLTADVKSMTQSIDDIEIGKYVDGTAIGDGLMHSIKLLSQVKAPRKTIVLITDGIQNWGKFLPLFSSRIASQKGIRIVSLGIGSDKNAMTPVSKKMNGEYVYALSGGSKIDESTLKTLTQNTNGNYLRVLDEMAFDDSLDQILKTKDNAIQYTFSPIDQKLLEIYFQKF